jgi:hypothetical protein
MRRIGFLLTVVSALFVMIGPAQPGYAMSFGKHNNGGGAPGQSLPQGNSGKGNARGDGSDGPSLNAQPYQIPVPEPSTVVLLASGVLGLGVWRWKRVLRHGVS